MTDFLLLATILLVSGVIAVPIATKFGLGSVLGYLIAGIAISPVLTLLRVDVASIQQFAEFGVVMMLFIVGLELEPKKLWEMRSRLIGLGGLQIAGTTLAIMLAAVAFGLSWRMALAIGLILTVSSTAIVLQTLEEKGLTSSDGGKASFSVLLFQDIAVIPMLALIPLLAVSGLDAGNASSHASSSNHATISLVAGLSGWHIALVNATAIIFVLFTGTILTPKIFRFIAQAHLRELFTAAALMLVIGIALLMSLVGLSPALGTFLAGVLLANSEFRHELEADIQPFKGLLLGLFFITVGASINFSLFFNSWPQIIGLTLLLMLVKGAVLAFCGWIFRVRGSQRWLMALGLAQTGEFGFVLLSFSVANKVLPSHLASQLMLVVALSMLLTPLLFIAWDRLQSMHENRDTTPPDEILEKEDVIIIGHGRVGGIVNRMLRSEGINTTVIDYSSAQLKMLQTFNLRIYFGDGTRPDLLHAAGIETARVLVVAIDDKNKTTQLVEWVTRKYPRLHVVARAYDRWHVYDLWSVGCRDIIRETYDSSLRMGKSVLEALGIESDKAQELTTNFEARDRRLMRETANVYRRGVPLDENTEYVAKVNEVMKDWEEELLQRTQALSKKSGTA